MSRKHILALASGLLFLTSASLGLLARTSHQGVFLKGALVAILSGFRLMFFSDRAGR